MRLRAGGAVMSTRLAGCAPAAWPGQEVCEGHAHMHIIRARRQGYAGGAEGRCRQLHDGWMRMWLLPMMIK